MLRILIADDELDARDNMIAMIDWEKRGMKVVAVEDNGLSAYESILSLGPDVVLIDIQMRGMNGLDVIEKVRAADCLQPVFIIISGYDDFTYTQKAIRLKVDGYLLKPFRPMDALAIIDEHFSDTSASRDIRQKQPELSAFLPELNSRSDKTVNYPIQEEGRVIQAMLSGTPDELRCALGLYTSALQSQHLPTVDMLNCHIILYAEICRYQGYQGVIAGLENIRWNSQNPIESIQELMMAVALNVRRELDRTVLRGDAPALRAKAYIDENFAQVLSLDVVARAVSVVPTYLSSCFARDIGMGFVDYIKSVRVAHAKRMLAHSVQTVAEISAACGYPDVKYFKQVFKQLTGLSPFAYRQSMSSNNEN